MDFYRNNGATAAARTIEIKNIVLSDTSKSQIYKFIREHGYEKAGPGIYVSPDAFADELFVLYKRCPGGVISHDEALYYYGLIDREPLFHTVTVYSGYNTARLKKAGYKTYYVKKELLELGKTFVTDHFGNNIPMYDMERTIVDMIRNRSQFEIQDFNTVLKSYAAKPNKNLTKLAAYAEAFKVGKILRNYLEVLL